MNMMAILFGAWLLAAPASAEPTPTEPESQADYVIGIEDVLHVSVWGEPALNLTVRVRPDGKITVPLVNDVRVVGQTPEQARRTLAARLGNFIRDPNVTVVVDEINSFRIYVLGEVNKQGVLEFRRPVRLLQALSTAGGLTQFSKKELMILRDQDGVEQRIRVDYKRLVSPEGGGNLFLKPDDILIVN
jgi:polysaccharide export outer membrane protein